MKHVLLTAFLVLFGYATSQGQTPAQQRSVATFTAIDVTDGIQLYLRTGAEEGITIDASSPSLRAKIKARVVDQVLQVYFDVSADPTWKGLVNSQEKFAVYVDAKTVRALRASKGAAITLENKLSSNEPVTVDLLSGATLTGHLQVQTLGITLRGGSEARLTGTAATLDVQVREGSRFHSPRLEARKCTAFATSASHLQLIVQQDLEARSVNEAVIKYAGQPATLTERREQNGQIIRL